MTATFTAMVSGGFDLNMLVLDFPRADRCSDADWWPTVDAFEAALKTNGARGAIVASMPENLPEDHADELLRRGIVPLHGIAEAMDAAEAAAFIGEAWAARPCRSPPTCRERAERGARVMARRYAPRLTPPRRGRGRIRALARRSRRQGDARGGWACRAARAARRQRRRGRRCRRERSAFPSR